MRVACDYRRVVGLQDGEPALTVKARDELVHPRPGGPFAVDLQAALYRCLVFLCRAAGSRSPRDDVLHGEPPFQALLLRCNPPHLRRQLNQGLDRVNL